MLLFRRISLLATASVYFLIYVGGLVRVSGAGLGCPDWPRCFGRWIPPLSAGQLPMDIDPSTFNFTLAWIEYFNRLIGVGVGLLVLLTAVLAWKSYRRRPAIVWPAAGAALLTGFQGWLGGVVVNQDLEPFLVSLHMLLAMIIVSLLIWVTFRAYAIESSRPQAVLTRGRTSAWLFVLWGVTVVQIVLGTRVREALEGAARNFPLLQDSALLERIGAIGLFHGRLGSGLTMVLLVTCIVLLRRRHRLPGLAVHALGGTLALGLVAGALGAMIWSLGVHPVLQLMHLWVASLLAGAVLICFLAVRYLPVTAGHPVGRAALVGPIVAGLVALGLFASVVVNHAEFARRQLPVLGEVPEFTFMSQTGAPWGRDQLTGKLSVVYFGFASCRGPCPLMNAHVAELYRLYEGSDRVQFAEISVDPDRDSLEALAALAHDLGVHDGRWVFLRAPLEDVVRLSENGFMMAADNLPGGHSIKLVLVDEQGRIRGYYDGRDAEAVALLKSHIRELVRAHT